MNQVTLVGRLGRAPEKRTTQGGKSVCSFSLATSEGYGDSQNTEWHSVVAWDKTADFLAQYADAGRLASVVGRLKTRTYEKDGVTHRVTEVVAHSVQLLDKKPQAQDKPHEQKPRKQGAQRGDYRSTGYDDDDIPF